MNWQTLLCREKIYSSSLKVNDDNERSEFERDHNKIIFAACFRSLQNKTQLFSVPHSDFIHSRLTHSLEVASVGKSLGSLVGKKLIDNGLVENNANFTQDISEIISAACLLHDVGNPPFGHAGEDAISNFFIKNQTRLQGLLPENAILELSNFNGNAQTFRIINNAKTLNLTLATVAAIIKYPTTYNALSIYGNKNSVFDSEEALLNKAFTACNIKRISNTAFVRHPLVFLVEAADDICYQLLDLEDAHKLGLISYEMAEKLLFRMIEIKRKDLVEHIKSSLENLNQENKFARLRSYVLNILIGEAVNKFVSYYVEIMTGEYDKLLINNKLQGLIDLLLLEDTELSIALRAIGEFTKNNAYNYKPLLEIELAGYEVLDYLLNQFVFAVINNKTQRDSRLIQLLPGRINLNSLDNLGKVMQITDYISSMTDKYAFDLYQKLTGIIIKSV